nr:hypothetical protein [Mycobacterium simulans]
MGINPVLTQPLRNSVASGRQHPWRCSARWSARRNPGKIGEHVESQQKPGSTAPNQCSLANSLSAARTVARSKRHLLANRDNVNGEVDSVLVHALSEKAYRHRVGRASNSYAYIGDR